MEIILNGMELRIVMMKQKKSMQFEHYEGQREKLVPSVEFKAGNSFSTAKSGKTLTVNPQLLEKMQNNPEKEKEMILCLT